MQETTGSILYFIEKLFGIYIMLIQDLMNNASIPEFIKYTMIGIYSVFFIIFLFLFFWFLKFVLTLIVRGISALFQYITDALNDSESIPYIAILILVRSVPWYFSLLLIILTFCGLAAIITGSVAWSESFKYILGATVGSLIGVVKKKEESEFEDKLFNAIGTRPPLSQLDAEQPRQPSPGIEKKDK
jgi:hypothetical protein